MRNFRTLFRRELATLYYTPTSYVVMCVFLIVVGWLFWILVNYLNAPSEPIDANVFGYLFGGTFIYWMVVAAVTSALTMRSFSDCTMRASARDRWKRSGLLRKAGSRSSSCSSAHPMTFPLLNAQTRLSPYMNTRFFPYSLPLKQCSKTTSPENPL